MPVVVHADKLPQSARQAAAKRRAYPNLPLSDFPASNHAPCKGKLLEVAFACPQAVLEVSVWPALEIRDGRLL